MSVAKYSVFDWNSGKYEYYIAPGGAGVAPQPKRYRPGKRTGGDLGAAPEDIQVKLPRNAKRVGQGDAAVGVVAVGDTDSADWGLLNVGLLLLSAAVIYKVTVK